MTVHARRIAAVPRRSSVESWRAICDLVARPGSAARAELDIVAPVAAMLIAEEYTRNAPIVFSGVGPQVRIYTLHGEDAVEADLDAETPLAFDVTDGDWHASMPCGAVDFDEAEILLRSSPRINVRDAAEGASVADGAPRATSRPIIVLDELDSP